MRLVTLRGLLTFPSSTTISFDEFTDLLCSLTEPLRLLTAPLRLLAARLRLLTDPLCLAH